MLHVIATHVARPEREDDLRRALLGLVAPSRAENGCLLYDLHEDRAAPGLFVFYEAWADQATFDAHKASEHLAAHAAREEDLTAESSVRVLEKLA